MRRKIYVSARPILILERVAAVLTGLVAVVALGFFVGLLLFAPPFAERPIHFMWDWNVRLDLSQMAATLITFVIHLCVIYRLAANTRRLGLHVHDSPFWETAMWLIPVANIFRPYQNLADHVRLFTVGHDRVLLNLRIWWVLWLALFIMPHVFTLRTMVPILYVTPLEFLVQYGFLFSVPVLFYAFTRLVEPISREQDRQAEMQGISLTS